MGYDSDCFVCQLCADAYNEFEIYKDVYLVLPDNKKKEYIGEVCYNCIENNEIFEKENNKLAENVYIMKKTVKKIKITYENIF